MVRSGGFRLVIDKWLRLGRQNSLFRRILSVQAEDSAVDELAVLHILQRDIRGAFRLLGRSGGAELRARHADLFERRGNDLLRLAEGIVQITVALRSSRRLRALSRSTMHLSLPRGTPHASAIIL